MIDALDSETRTVGEGADMNLPSQAALACPPRLTRIRQYFVIVWDAAPGFARTVSTMISLILLAALAVLLTQELSKRTLTITPISVLKELAGDGYAAACNHRRSCSQTVPNPARIG
jgi:hypothetical protein